MRFLLAALLFAGGCAAQATQTREEPGPQLRVEALGLACAVSGASLEGDELARLGRALHAAAPRLRRWGTFRSPLRLELLADHALLEEGSGERESPWLRAWSSGGVIFVQHPRSWPEAAGRSPEELDALLAQLLAHELAHALLEQLLAREGDARAEPALAEPPPLWFREGMASVIANQGPGRMTPAQLGQWLLAHPGVELLAPTETLLREEQAAVYSAAHRAFELLLERGGAGTPLAVIAAMRGGARFEQAFADSTGSTPTEFAARAAQVWIAALHHARRPLVIPPGPPRQRGNRLQTRLLLPIAGALSGAPRFASGAGTGQGGPLARAAAQFFS